MGYLVIGSLVCVISLALLVVIGWLVLIND